MRAERITDSLCYHGEGPVWWPSGVIRWVDMLAGDVLTLDTDGEVTRTHVGTIAACLRPRAGGGAIIAGRHGLVTTERDDLGELRSHPDVITDPGLRFNEGGCDPDGRFWCGSMAEDQAKGAATLYRFTTDLGAEVVLPHVTVSNGIDWSPDGRTGYHNDTATGTISCFDRDEHGGMTDRRTFVDCEGGSPDGLTVDAEGNVWTAMHGDGAVRCYSPAGTLEQVVEVGARQVTACTFGGPDLRTLYITTSRENLPAGEDPQAGSLFAVSPGAVGRPAQVWRP